MGECDKNKCVEFVFVSAVCMRVVLKCVRVIVCVFSSITFVC